MKPVFAALENLISIINLKKDPFERGLIYFIDNSLEISNISLTPRNIIDTHHIMTLIMNE